MYGSDTDLRSLSETEKSYNVDYFAFLDKENKTTTGWKKLISLQT